MTFTYTPDYPRATIPRSYLKGITAGNYIQVIDLADGYVTATEPGFPRLYVLHFNPWVYAPSSKMLRLDQIFDAAGSHAYNSSTEIDYGVFFKLIADSDFAWRLHLWSGAAPDSSNRRDLPALSGYWLPI